MTIALGIETSCDETRVGLVRHGELLGEAPASSMDEHARFGGVVPEIAVRAHVSALVPCVREAMRKAATSPAHIGAIAVTVGPGLATALHVGVAAAKAYAGAWGVPLYGVHHLAARRSCTCPTPSTTLPVRRSTRSPDTRAALPRWTLDRQIGPGR